MKNWAKKRKKSTNVLSKIPEINDLMELVDEIVQNVLLPAIKGEKISWKIKRIIFTTSSIKGLGYSFI